ncbi:MAG TPA: ATP-dependent DNA helicase [Steroidobacteraceae bacterium]
MSVRPDWEEIFGPEGPLARAIPGYTVRAEQIDMAAEVDRALRTRGRLVVEAGTGTGKTFAYLVPAMLSGQRVVISTGTRTLQDQLYMRDVPMVAAALGRPVRIALLKGRANYLCLHRLELAEQQARMRGLLREVAIALPRVRDWARTTRRGDIGEVADLGESAPVWPWVTSTRDNCLGADCAAFDRCHVVHARREALAADVVIVNHHLLMADLVLKEEGFGDLLPSADAVVIDEAHQLADVAAMFLGFVVSTRQMQVLARDLASELLAGAPAVESAAPQTIERHIGDLQDSFAGIPERLEAEHWSAGAIECLDRIKYVFEDLAHSLASFEHAGLASIRQRAAELVFRIDTLLAKDEDQAVRWAQQSNSNLSFHYAPIDVATPLGRLIGAHAGAWICASATLSVAGDFSHFTRRIGMSDARAVQFGSPFDFERQALLYLPPGIDAPSSPRHTQQVVEAALPILAASGGRAFLLFTSHRALREAAEILRQRLGPKPPFPILVQGDAPRDALLTRFREHGAAVLLGTSSFWEGVDVKGAALSVVVIDKLPFAAPDDPVLKARLAAVERNGGNPFFDEQVPQAVIALKQGVGRLIRDQDDFGVIVLCDRRVRSRGYGRIFLNSLPPMRHTEDLAEACAFLRAKLAALGLSASTSLAAHFS